MSEEVVLVTGALGELENPSLRHMRRLVGMPFTARYKHFWKKKIDQVLEKYSGIGSGLVFNMLDEAIDDFVKNFLSEYGTPSILINNAGVTDDALFLRMRESQWDNVIDTNLKGTFRITKALFDI